MASPAPGLKIGAVGATAVSAPTSTEVVRKGGKKKKEALTADQRSSRQKRKAQRRARKRAARKEKSRTANEAANAPKKKPRPGEVEQAAQTTSDASVIDAVTQTTTTRDESVTPSIERKRPQSGARAQPPKRASSGRTEATKRAPTNAKRNIELKRLAIGFLMAAGVMLVAWLLFRSR